MSIINTLKRNLINIPGWRTNRKIVVIESDDWGSIRMPSKQVYDNLLKAGVRVDKCPYNRFDSLASEDDLTALFDVLVKFKDKNGNHPIITANSVVANPDFELIQKSNYKEYHYELFTKTLKRYPNHKFSFELWKKGISEKLFFPQFHGREHVNISRWINALQANSEETMFAFKEGIFGLSTTIVKEKRKSYQAALDFDNSLEFIKQKGVIASGLDLFEESFGYKSKSFIAPNYVWHPEIEKELAKQGVEFIQSSVR